MIVFHNNIFIFVLVQFGSPNDLEIYTCVLELHRIKRSTDDAHSESCGISSTDVYKWMESVRNSAVKSSVPNHVSFL